MVADIGNPGSHGSGLLPTRLQLGDFTITALRDGQMALSAPFLMQQDNAYRAAPDPLPLDINGFLISRADRHVLVDTGCGSKLGTTVNHLARELAAVGVAPEDIAAVLCTHIHPDHTNGLIDHDGQARFPNAQIYVHQSEIDYWLDEANASRAPAGMKIQFEWARDAFRPYAGRVTPFSGGPLIDAVEAVPLYGHTPGHSGFHLDAGGGRQLLIWGDVVHHLESQAPHPEVTVVADMDQSAARETRWTLFDRLASDETMFAGMHVGSPMFGRLHRDGDGYGFSRAV